jgi:lysozyme
MSYGRRLNWILGIAAAALATNAHAARDFGVDVSHYQGDAGVSASSWSQMYTAGKRFAFIKATEGLTGPDDNAMAANVARASAAGLAVGVYHYAHAENRPTTAGAVLEANHLLTYAGTAIGPGKLKPVIDLEGSVANLSTTALTDWVIAFADTIVAARGEAARPILYCSDYFANNELDSRLANYDLWLRVIGGDPSVGQPPDRGYPLGATGVFNHWSFWQYSATGSSGGISPLDLNVVNSEYKTLATFIVPEPATLACVIAAAALTQARRRVKKTPDRIGDRAS